MLDDMDLPPVEERLPNEPKLVNEMPPELLDFEVGQYGGTIRTVTAQVNWDADVFVMNNEPLLNTPGILGEEITGNILKGFEVSADEKEFTFYMREGLKWSDGVPVTMEDVRFTMEDHLFNEEITPIFPGYMRTGGTAKGEPFEFSIVDDWTFKLTFDEPYGGLIIRMTIQGWRGYTEFLKPAHYLKQYHKDYADPEEYSAMLEEAGIEEDLWMTFYNMMDIVNWELTHEDAVGFPVLYPWKHVESTNQYSIFERNPYYFKVDPAGQQLPYIDKIESTLVQDIEMISVKVLAGEVDFVRESAALVNMPLYRENEAAGGFRALLNYMHVNPTDIFFNLTYDDPDWQEVVQDVRFRKAISLATDRDEIIDAIYYGFAEPGVIQDSTFDLDAANELLDEMGMEIGADGYRQTPSGAPFSILMELGAQAPDIVPLGELLVEQWSALDLNVDMRRIEGSLWGTKNAANELQCTMIWTHVPLWYMEDWGMGLWAPSWNLWRTTGGEQGEEPPAEVQEFYDLVASAMVSTPDDARALIEEVKANLGVNNWYLIHLENVQQPLVVNAKMRNVTDKGFAIATNFSAEQFWYAD
jgi:peptide/nickel transport system substrate-binding protein